MSKQSSIEWLISCITEDQMVKAKSLNEWLEIFQQAKAMHKEEMINFSYKVLNESNDSFNGYVDEEKIYNETFGGGDEN